MKIAFFLIGKSRNFCVLILIEIIGTLLFKMAYFQVCLSYFHSMKILHLQSLYVATNCSSIDIDILGVCVMPTLGIMDVPVYLNTLFVHLPRTSGSL